VTAYNITQPGEKPERHEEEGFELSSLEAVLKKLLKLGFFIAAPNTQRRGHLPLTEHNVHDVVSGQPHKRAQLALIGVSDEEEPKPDPIPSGPFGGSEGFGAH